MTGLATARAEGKTFGRPRVDGDMEWRIAELHATGLGYVKDRERGRLWGFLPSNVLSAAWRGRSSPYAT